MLNNWTDDCAVEAQQIAASRSGTFCVVEARLSLWLIGTVRAEPETVISRAWVQSPDPAE